ncbi:MAG: ferrous iron transport protein B [Rikenellaceae bacterium]
MNLPGTDDLYLSALKVGEEGIIIRIKGCGAFRHRITEMGFIKGKKVKVIKNAPLQDPVEYEIMGYNVSLRRSESGMIQVIRVGSSDNPVNSGKIRFDGMVDESGLKRSIVKRSTGEKGWSINVALVGNPNSGKTTLYNFASGSHEKVANYGGVTVDARETKFKKSSYLFRITDLPGTYSITEYSPEELFVRTHILEDKPDVVVNVIDASNLERNLYLTTQLIDMDIKVVIALNMFDELENRGDRLDYETLAKMTGIPIVPTVASKGRGIDRLFDKIIEVYQERDPVVRHIHINYGSIIEGAISHIEPLINENKEVTDRFSSRYLAIKLLESDSVTYKQIASCPNFNRIKNRCEIEIKALEREYKENAASVITDAKYGFIAGALSETFRPGTARDRKGRFNIDDILTHKYLGLPVFLFFMWLMFQVTFTLGSYPMDWINVGVGWLGEQAKHLISPGPLRELIVEGIIGGVGGVIVYLPNILILFFFISFMEDTGYMARASFIMDKLMHKIGLHGKSFIPMLMGFGCNVPAIMATRTLENRKDRLLTMMIIPFMSCSARLPVYVLIISAFFPYNQGLVMISIYMAGVFIAVLSALMMKKVFFAKQDIPFVMELPPYRIPTLRSTLLHMWHKGAQYLRKMGTIILAASVLIWALGRYPAVTEYSVNYDKQIEQIALSEKIPGTEKDEMIKGVELAKKAEEQEASYIGRLGHLIEPVIRPLGFDWKMGVSILTGLVAKEVVVSTMGVLYQVDAASDENSNTLQSKLKDEKVFTPLVAYGFMLFVLIYIPCIATVVAIKKEAGWRWALFSVIYTTTIAWVVAFITFQTGMALHIILNNMVQNIIVIAILAAAAGYFIYKAIKRTRGQKNDSCGGCTC